MSLLGEFTGQGRVVGGYLVNGTVLASKDGLSIQKFIKRHKIAQETVSAWEELRVEKSAAKIINSVAGTILPRGIGRTVGATIGASVSLGHTVKILWVTEEQSVIELPEKLFMILKTLLVGQEVKQVVYLATENSDTETSLAEQLVELVAQILPKNGTSERLVENSAQESSKDSPQRDVIDQLERLSTLRNQGVLSDEEFAALKDKLLDNA
jgi:hypothetical protein